MNIAIITHDPLDDSIPLYRELWGDLIAAFQINHVYKVGGEQAKGFVQYGPEHTIPSKMVCVMTTLEAKAANIESISLKDYIHPKECTYVFGPDNDVRGWHEKFAGPDTDYISIIAPHRTDLYAFMAATFVLGNRIGIL